MTEGDLALILRQSDQETIDYYAKTVLEMDAELTALRAEVERLREALAPFAADAAKRPWITSESAGMDEFNIGGSGIGGSGITNGDLRRAALAMPGADTGAKQ